MFRDEYRKEMDQVIWNEEQRERLRQVMAQPNGRPRRLTRRTVAAVAVAAALVVSAVAAGTSIWQTIRAKQGPFSAIAQTIQGAVCTDQGIEIQVLSALADDVRAEIYFTVRDTTGDRLDDQLTLHRTEDSDMSGRLVAYDPASHTALFMASLSNYSPQTETRVGVLSVDGKKGGWMGEHTRLSLDGLTTRQGDMEAQASCAGVSDELLQSLPLGAQDKVVMGVEESGYTRAILPDTQVVLAPNQTPMALDGTQDMTISSMGFASDGRFHIRVAYAQGINHEDVNHGYFLARVYPRDEDRMGEEKYWLPMVITQVEGGMDVMFPLIKAGEADELGQVSFYGRYQRPGVDIAGSWAVDFSVDYHPSTVLAWTGEIAGRQVDHVTVSPLTVTMDSDDRGGFSTTPLYAVLQDGTRVAAQCSGGQYANVSQDPAVEVWDAYNTWEFEQPVAVEDIDYLILLDEQIPMG